MDIAPANCCRAARATNASGFFVRGQHGRATG